MLDGALSRLQHHDLREAVLGRGEAWPLDAGHAKAREP
jgi:hypothetical protein